MRAPRAAARSGIGALRRRPVLAAALIYAALMMLFLGPGLLPGKTLSNSDILWIKPPWVAQKPAALEAPTNPDLSDAPLFTHLLLQHAAREMPDVPLWNPHIMGGRPFAGDGQSALFGPYTWPAYVLPFWTALGWIGVLKLWVAAFGTFLLGRSLGMRFAGALLAGIVFALSLKLVTWLIYPAMGVWTWYPWLLLCTECLVRRPDLLAGAGLAAVVALQFLTGHPESSFQALVLTSCFFALRLWQARRAGASAVKRLRTPLFAMVGAVAAGAAVAAVALIPFGELLLLSADFTDRRGESVDASLPLRDAVGVFMPDFWGRPTQTPIRPILLERAMYVGALPLMLAAVALVVRPTLTRIWVALFGGLWFAVVLGIPPFVQVVTRLPIFNSGHNTRLIVFSILAVALLAGWGLDGLTGPGRIARRRRDFALGAAAVLLLVPLVIVAAGPRSVLGALGRGFEIAWLFADPPGQYRDPRGADAIRASSLIIWLTVAGGAMSLLALRFGRRVGRTAFAVLALLLVCVDLFRAGMGHNPAIDRDVASVPKTGAIRFLERQSPARFVSTGEIPDNVIPMEFRLYEARGYDVPIVRRFDRLWRREVVPGARSVAAGFIDIPLRLGAVTPRTLRTLGLLGVTHVLGPTTIPARTPPFDRLVPVPALRLPGLTPVYSGPDARIYRVERALPRTWVVGVQRVVSSESAALDAIVHPGFDALRVAVTERRLAGLPEEPAAPFEGASAGSARIETYEPERVVVRARSAGPGVVVLSDTHYPGWRAKVDGREAPIVRVDYLFRGVRVGAGSHTIEFRYDPVTWRTAWIVSALSLAGLLLAAAAGWRRRRGPDRAGASRGAGEQVGRGQPARA